MPFSPTKHYMWMLYVSPSKMTFLPILIMSTKNLYLLAFVLIAAGGTISIPAFLTWIDFIFSNADIESISPGSIFTQAMIGSLLGAAGTSLWKTAIALDSKTSIHVNAQKNQGIINLLGTIIGNLHNDVNKKR